LNCSANKNDILFQKKQKTSARAALSIRGLFVQALIRICYGLFLPVAQWLLAILIPQSLAQA
jgi:hypothetical protein